ncbi:hypothetical protein ARMGADRAFT_1161336 [Armillaria gallica]|uniref:Uncharacterized protein n=1 Tax=Armillaria gallica TaxID=47427 RepID=A0A2H3EET5_ARMGA|nr:hypothetical protein ARMGADRAFT_1161336 [Armillaria gallica]
MDPVGSSISSKVSKSFDDGNLYNGHVDISGVDERKLLRKIDIALVPWLSFLYLLSFLDRTSIGNAKVWVRYTGNQPIDTTIVVYSCITSKPTCILRTVNTFLH